MGCRRLALLLGTIFTLTALPLAAAPASRHAEPLFTLARRKNANEVHYDASLSSTGALDARAPVVAYWVMLARDGHTEPLTWEEHRAYGFDVTTEPGGAYRMSLHAYKDRALELVRVKGHWRARINIAGHPAYIDRLFVEEDESGLIPHVIALDLIGHDVASGAPVKERIVR